MFSFFFFKIFNANLFVLQNKFFNFVFFFNLEKSFFFSFCFRLSKFLFFFNCLNVFCLVYPFFLKKSFNSIRNLIFRTFFYIHFFFKQRLRFSGLGYCVDIVNDSQSFLKINVGLTSAPVFFNPKHVFFLKVNRKKKKILLKGYVLYLLNNFCSLLRSVKKCDVYKHKGIRWRFEKIKTKEGKRSGNR